MKNHPTTFSCIHQQESLLVSVIPQWLFSATPKTRCSEPPRRHRSTLFIKDARSVDDLWSVVDIFAQNNFQKQEAIHRIIYIVHALSRTFVRPSKMKIAFPSIAYNSVEAGKPVQLNRPSLPESINPVER